MITGGWSECFDEGASMRLMKQVGEGSSERFMGVIQECDVVLVRKCSVVCPIQRWECSVHKVLPTVL